MGRAFAVSGRGSRAEVQEIDTPAPGPGQIRVAVAAASLNGIDAMTAGGHMWDLVPHTFPVVIGRDAAGTVAEVGPGVTTVRQGDEVATVVTGMTLELGMITEDLVVAADQVVPVPPNVSAVDAAAAGLAGITAYDLIHALRVGPDDTVLVSGASGGVGVFAVQLALQAGATVIATARPGDATDVLRKVGAQHVVDHTADLAGGVRAIAPGGVTAVVHAAGEARELGALLAPNGRLASVVGATAEAVGRSDVTVTPVMAQYTPDKYGTLLAGLGTGSLRVPPLKTYNLDGAPQALADFAAPKVGKIVITPR